LLGWQTFGQKKCFKNIEIWTLWISYASSLISNRQPCHCVCK
jgi:hypothetical protein